MLKIGLTVALISVQLSLKDTPAAPPPPPTQAQHYVKVLGIQGKFEIPAQIMKKYGLYNGEWISPRMARLIASEMGYKEYTPEMRVILQQLDFKEKP